MAKSSDIPKFGVCSGIRVVHHSTSVAGPFAAELYADNGADVIWIENPKVPCMTRTRYGNTWQQNAKNERNISLNIPSPEGKEIFLKLMEQTDVFIEASQGRHWDKWGLSDEVLWKHNPRLVIVHISGFGQDGAPGYPERASFDPIAQAFGCYMDVNGFPDSSPLPVMPFPIDNFCALFAFGMSNAAVAKSRQTGKGESIDIAQYEIAMRVQSFYPMDYIMHGDLPPREGNHSATTCGYGLYECKDGKAVYMLILGNGALKKALPLLGLEFGSELFPANASMIYANTPAGDLFEEKLHEFCSQHTAKEVERILLDNNISCSMVMNIADAEFHPHYIAREVFTEWDSIDGKRLKGVNILPKMKNYPGQIWRGAPKIGMDNEDILSELGISSEQIKNLYDKGIIVKAETPEPPPAFKKTRDWQQIAKEKMGK